jgi:7-keto-8-aminopelargonate synthetase-like enzyme
MGARFKLIATDGVFSMDGYVANLSAICDLAERYGALVMVDDCHATGHLGEAGRGPSHNQHLPHGCGVRTAAKVAGSPTLDCPSDASRAEYRYL